MPSQQSCSNIVEEFTNRILVVEDDPFTLKYLCAILKSDGYEVIAASNGAVALEAIKDDPPDLVLCDIEMPEINGFRLLAKLRDSDDGHDLPVIFLSAARDCSTKVAGLDSGANDYITKPINAAELKARIRSQLRSADERRVLRTMSFFDELTGVYNRRAMSTILSRELNRAQRSAGKLSVMVIDLNGFKAINDEFGHAAGDEVLRIVAACLNEAVRSSDTVARFGGDEFVIILPQAGKDAAARLADRIRGQVAKAADRAGMGDKLGAAIGLAEFDPDGDTPSTLLLRADKAMYIDKAEFKRGRR
ncbi:MAG: diguanylate cyclase [Proteobacteria bacterium]|nr:diguanylate cyclase [Pseudomonadota bacterium]